MLRGGLFFFNRWRAPGRAGGTALGQNPECFPQITPQIPAGKAAQGAAPPAHGSPPNQAGPGRREGSSSPGLAHAVWEWMQPVYFPLSGLSIKHFIAFSSGNDLGLVDAVSSARPWGARRGSLTTCTHGAHPRPGGTEPGKPRAWSWARLCPGQEQEESMAPEEKGGSRKGVLAPCFPRAIRALPAHPSHELAGGSWGPCPVPAVRLHSALASPATRQPTFLPVSHSRAWLRRMEARYCSFL